MDFSALNRKYWVGGIVMEKVILCYGDSNTWGYNPATAKRFPREIRWTGRLQALLGKEYVVIEEGLNSRTVVWDDPVNGYRSGFSYLIPCLDSQKPVDLVIVMLGTNDTQERFQLNGFNIARSMRRILDAIEISRSGPNETAPKVLLVAPPHILDSLPETDLGENMGKGCEQRSKEIAKYYQLLSEERGVAFLDAQAFVQASEIDAVHLDENGHRRLAEVLENDRFPVRPLYAGRIFWNRSVSDHSHKRYSVPEIWPGHAHDVFPQAAG